MTTLYISPRAQSNLPMRREFDFYPTPMSVAADALTFLPTNFKPQCILDPGAGTGVWGKAARKIYPQALLTGIDIRSNVIRPAAYNFWFNSDFLLTEPQPAFDCIIGNPPYNVADQFIKHSMNLLESGGYLVFLLRLNILEGIGRARGLHRHYPPRWVIVRAARVSFTGDGKSNATAYGYFIWQKGYVGEPSLRWSLTA